MGEQKSGKKNDLREELLDGWLNMSTSICNDRLVSAMTYNESMVCGALYKQMDKDAPLLTATDLCTKLQILKPQMNVILNRLEKKGMIERIRSKKDRRQVNIRLTGKGIPVYERAHEEILKMPQWLIDRLGEEKMRVFAASMQEVAACFHQVLEEGREANGSGGQWAQRENGSKE